MFQLILLSLLSSCVWAKSFPNFGVLPQFYPLIVGGRGASIEKYPHQVALFMHGTQICGGSIYSKNVVITAAHCLRNNNPELYEIYAGTTRLSEKKLKFSVSKIYKHELYKTYDFDIAFLVIDGEFEFSNRVQPIALAESRPPAGSEVTTIGWGRTSFGGITSDLLLEVQVKIVDDEVCRQQYEDLSITENMICAGVKEGGKDSCDRDSGGPLLADKKLLGVVSFGHGCGSRNFSGVYASIPVFRDWILETLQRHHDSLE